MSSARARATPGCRGTWTCCARFRSTWCAARAVRLAPPEAQLRGSALPRFARLCNCRGGDGAQARRGAAGTAQGGDGAAAAAGGGSPRPEQDAAADDLGAAGQQGVAGPGAWLMDGRRERGIAGGAAEQPAERAGGGPDERGLLPGGEEVEAAPQAWCACGRCWRCMVQRTLAEVLVNAVEVMVPLGLLPPAHRQVTPPSARAPALACSWPRQQRAPKSDTLKLLARTSSCFRTTVRRRGRVRSCPTCEACPPLPSTGERSRGLNAPRSGRRLTNATRRSSKGGCVLNSMLVWPALASRRGPCALLHPWRRPQELQPVQPLVPAQRRLLAPGGRRADPGAPSRPPVARMRTIGTPGGPALQAPDPPRSTAAFRALRPAS